MDNTQLSFWADIIGLVSGIMAILGISGILSWSAFKKGQGTLPDIILSIFAYSIKTAICLFLFGIFGFFFLISGLFFVSTFGILDQPLLSYENSLAVTMMIVLGMVLVPIFLILCACIYTSSRKPFYDLIEKLGIKDVRVKPGSIVTTTRPAIEGDLIIRNATYGAKGHRKNVTDILKTKMSGGKLEICATNNELGGDPAPLTEKELRVDYTYHGKRLAVVIQENQTLSLP